MYVKRGENAKYMINCISNVIHGLHFFQKEEKILITEPTHYFIHRIMSSSSYNQEDLISYARYMKLKQHKIAIWDEGNASGKNEVPGKTWLGKYSTLQLPLLLLSFPPLPLHCADSLRPFHSIWCPIPSYLPSTFFLV